MLLLFRPRMGVAPVVRGQDGIWQIENRHHQNRGHWDDVSQGRAMRWPP